MIKYFEVGATVWVQLGKGKKYAGKVLASSDASTSEHGYELFKVELEETITGWDGKPQVNRWTHPKPIQGYKLSKRTP